MQKVEIYLFTSSKAFSTESGSYEYILECNGRTASGFGKTGPITAHRLLLTCAIEALKRMNRPAVLNIHTDCQYLISSRMYLKTWRDNAWTKPGGKPLKNADLWQEWYEVSHQHAVKYEYCPTINLEKDELKKKLPL